MFVIRNHTKIIQIEEGEDSVLIVDNLGNFKGVLAKKTDGLKIGDVVEYERFEERPGAFAAYAIFVRKVS